MTSIVRSISIAVLLASWSPSQAVSPAELAGTWRLTEVAVSNLADSNPTGIPAGKEIYTPGGKLFFVAAEDTLNDATPWVSYTIDADVRTVRRTDRPQSSSARIRLEGSDELVVTQRSGDVWRYRRMPGENAANEAIEPVSVERIASTSPAEPELTSYDTKDYSALALPARLAGAWEVIGYLGVPRAEMPPYGFPNDVWVFNGATLVVMSRGAPAGNTDPGHGYRIGPDGLAIDGMAEHLPIAFDRWGHLDVDLHRVRIVLKLISKSTVGVRLPPLKVALAQPAGGAKDP